MERIIEYTADGSATLFVPELNEHYHSVKGALTESSHIFIDMGLKASASPAPHILEIGFGTGLNALLTLIEAERSGSSPYITLGRRRADHSAFHPEEDTGRLHNHGPFIIDH